MEPFILPLKDLVTIAPAIILLVWSTAILIGLVFVRSGRLHRAAPFYFALTGLALAGIAYFQLAGIFASLPHPEGVHYTFNQMYSLDGLTLFFQGVFLATGFLAVLISPRFLDEENAASPEYYALILLSVTGMMLLAGAADLITLYICLEFMAISVYILVGYLKTQSRATEASLKYFILGAFSSALILFGMSLVFALTGTTNLEAIHGALKTVGDGGQPLLVLALILFLAGLGFKIAAVPFHMWCPDAYEGAPTPITAFISVAPKAAGFAIFIRLFMFLFQPLTAEYVSLVGLLSIVTMTVGNVLAVRQTNVKRLLAYSSISHAGYLLMGLMVREFLGLQAIGVYLVGYLFMNLGAFAVITFMRRERIGGEDIEDFSGLIHAHPVVAAAMAVFLLSLAGIPPTVGFIAKYWVFGAVIKAYIATTDRLFLYVAVAGALNAVVALFYYFRIVKRMFMGDAVTRPPLALGLPARIALGLTLAGTLFLGLYPDPAIRFAGWIHMTFIGFY